MLIAVRVATLLAVAAATGNSGPPAGNSPANNNNNLGFTLTIYEVDQSKLPPTLRLPELLAHTINLLNMDFDGRAVLRQALNKLGEALGWTIPNIYNGIARHGFCPRECKGYLLPGPTQVLAAWFRNEFATNFPHQHITVVVQQLPLPQMFFQYQILGQILESFGVAVLHIPNLVDQYRNSALAAVPHTPPSGDASRAAAWQRLMEQSGAAPQTPGNTAPQTAPVPGTQPGTTPQTPGNTTPQTAPVPGTQPGTTPQTPGNTAPQTAPVTGTPLSAAFGTYSLLNPLLHPPLPTSASPNPNPASPVHPAAPVVATPVTPAPSATPSSAAPAPSSPTTPNPKTKAPADHQATSPSGGYGGGVSLGGSASHGLLPTAAEGQTAADAAIQAAAAVLQTQAQHEQRVMQSQIMDMMNRVLVHMQGVTPGTPIGRPSPGRGAATLLATPPPGATPHNPIDTTTDTTHTTTTTPLPSNLLPAGATSDDPIEVGNDGSSGNAGDESSGSGSGAAAVATLVYGAALAAGAGNDDDEGDERPRRRRKSRRLHFTTDDE